MNVQSIEYGIIITGCEYRDLLTVLPADREFGEFATFRGKDVETHPWDWKNIFISYGDAVHGKKLPSDKGKLAAFRKRVGKVCKAKWGLIFTER